MIKYLLTEEGHPVKTNMPNINPKWTSILTKNAKEKNKDYQDRCKIEYKRLCREKNQEIEKNYLKGQ